MRNTPVFSAKILRVGEPKIHASWLHVPFRLRSGLRVWLCLGLGFVNCADHVQRTLRDVFKLVTQNTLTAVQRILEADELSLDTAKLLGGEETAG